MATLKEQYLEQYAYFSEINAQAKSSVPNHIQEELYVAHVIDSQLYEENKIVVKQFLVSLVVVLGVFCLPISFFTAFLFAGGLKILCTLGKEVDQARFHKEKVKELYPEYTFLWKYSRKSIQKRVKHLQHTIEIYKETLKERGDIINRNAFMIRQASESSIEEIENVKQIIMKQNQSSEPELSILHVNKNRQMIEELKQCRDLLESLEKYHLIWNTHFYNNYEQPENGWLKKK